MEKTKALDDFTIVQLGLIVRDLETTKHQVAEFLGVEVPPTVESGDYAVTQTVYDGQPAPDAACQMAFFYFGNLQVEFIQPNEAPSVWRDQLEQRGEGLHHIAFQVKGMKRYVHDLEALGIPMVQKGEYRRGNGRYAYFDARKTLRMFFELLESDEEGNQK